MFTKYSPSRCHYMNDKNIPCRVILEFPGFFASFVVDAITRRLAKSLGKNRTLIATIYTSSTYDQKRVNIRLNHIGFSQVDSLHVVANDITQTSQAVYSATVCHHLT